LLLNITKGKAWVSILYTKAIQYFWHWDLAGLQIQIHKMVL